MRMRVWSLGVCSAVLATFVAGSSAATTGLPVIVPSADEPDGPKSIAVKQYRGTTPSPLPELPELVVSLRPDDRLAITTWGSSSCPTVPTQLKVRGRQHIQVSLSNAYKRMCTMDMAPTTSEIALPRQRVDAKRPFTVDVVWSTRTAKIWVQPSTIVTVARQS